MKYVNEYREKSNCLLRIIVACLVFVAANAIDYLMTVSGIINSKFQEGNPVIQGYIDHFGLYNGVLIYKLLICNFILLGMLILKFKYKKEARKFKPEYILYFGSIFMLFGGMLWLV
jgi:hypothetical protein